MWKRAKKDLGTYQEAVINVKDAEGRGVSVGAHVGVGEGVLVGMGG